MTDGDDGGLSAAAFIVEILALIVAHLFALMFLAVILGVKLYNWLDTIQLRSGPPECADPEGPRDD